MIDPTRETIIDVPAAGDHPLMRNPRTGKPASHNAVYRKMIHGVKAPDGSIVKLETIRGGNGGLRTSREAVERFLRRLQDDPAALPPPPHRREAIAAADARTAQIG